jgi:hypothetical protein
MARTMGSEGQIAMNSTSKCANCGSGLPEMRSRYCSERCMAQFKREQQRLTYGHRHIFKCSECGYELYPGRPRK